MTGSQPRTPTVFISWAHRHGEWSRGQAAEWECTVHAFAHALRMYGIDADVDLWHQSDTRTDWTRWGQQQVSKHDFILVASNRSWRERWDGSNAPTEGAGVVREADALKGLFDQNQDNFRKRLILVLLPGADDTTIPTYLHGVTRCRVTSFDKEGLEVLLRLLTVQPRFLPPALGAVPVFPTQPPQIPTNEEALTVVEEPPPKIQDGGREGVLARAAGSGHDVVFLGMDSNRDVDSCLLHVTGNDESKLFTVKRHGGRLLLSSAAP